jgi:phage terminase large subunit GpA-like protein
MDNQVLELEISADLAAEYWEQMEIILEAGRVKLSTAKPSEWAEEKIIMPKPFSGPLRYERTPYWREIIDCLAPDHPAREIALMGAAQGGKSRAIILPGLGYFIDNDPSNIIMTVGHEELMEEAMDAVDDMLDSAGLRKLIKASAKRVKSQKTGDTSKMKQYAGGYFKLSPASNPKIWQQSNYKYGFFDDYERVRGGSKTAGNTRDLILKRFTVYDKTKKIFYASSPELIERSNIYEVYKMGDQRKFLVPCPCCGSFIELRWSTKGKKTEKAGVVWGLDQDGKLIPDSVGYICQECGDFFTDQYKHEWMAKGYWQPTATPSRPDFYSYHMSCLYAPHGMSDWKHYVYKYLEANPSGGGRIKDKYQTFVNLDLGEPYEEEGETVSAAELQNNIRNYDIGTIPEKMSLADGNGRIMMLTLSADLNGVLDDSRLDWEVVAWSESGSTYSVSHGSIGTFIPREGIKKKDREHFSCDVNKRNSIWPYLDQIMATKFKTDTDREMQIFIGAIDSGHNAIQVYAYIDKSNYNVRPVKGKDEDKYIKFGTDLPSFKVGKERPGLYLIEVMQVKDHLAGLMRLKWDIGNDDSQPPGFMNYPLPSDGLYLYQNFFKQYEAERRVVQTTSNGQIAVLWEKKDTVVQNHFWDVRVYNMAVRDIAMYEIGKSIGNTKFTWADWCSHINSMIPKNS